VVLKKTVTDEVDAPEAELIDGAEGGLLGFALVA